MNEYWSNNLDLSTKIQTHGDYMRLVVTNQTEVPVSVSCFIKEEPMKKKGRPRVNCTIDKCNRKIHGKGLCKLHYNREWKKRKRTEKVLEDYKHAFHYGKALRLNKDGEWVQVGVAGEAANNDTFEYSSDTEKKLTRNRYITIATMASLVSYDLEKKELQKHELPTFLKLLEELWRLGK